MAGPTLKRPRTFFEHSWPWAALTVLLALAFLALAYFGLRYLQSRLASAGTTFLLIVGLGAITLALILVTYFYSLRKRALQERLGGTMMSWLKSHVWLGALSVAAALAHAFVFPLTREVTSGKITAAVLILLVVSGALWRTVYAYVPPRVPGSVGNLSIRDTRRRVGELRGELEKLQVGKSAAFQRAVDELMSRSRKPGASDPDWSSLDPAEAALWDQVKDLASRIERHSVREARQRRFARIMQGWKLLHLPLAAILMGMVAFHLVDVFNFGRLFAGEAEKRFASSGDCANCHGGIVDEWKLSMHRAAQTSSITIAQTALALANSPEFEKLCVNCHAPIGTKFSQKATFTPARPDPANPIAVENEGVTCIVCHTMPRAPGEIAGAGGDLPVTERGATSFGTMFGPPLRDPPPIPVSAHDIEVGFMTESVAASQLCAACHNVIADIDGDGIIDQRFAGAVAAGGPTLDSDGNGVLDENELDIVDGKLEDLALQTTFDEWEDYVFKGGRAACSGCHMPGARGPLIDDPPPLGSEADRPRHQHYFAGVDYELNIAYYAKPGMPKGGLRTVLEEREKLLSRSATVSVGLSPISKEGRLTATVEVRAGDGHSFPTGFAFARQFWLEVSAKTASGKPVCLAPDQHGISSPCESGKISTPVEELATCDPAPMGLGNKEIKFAVVAPLDKCDPWLANFQKILTDGDPDGDGILTEVAYQSKRADIVKLRVRTADQQIMAPIAQGGAAKFDYVFDAAASGGEAITVRAVLRLRHLPPYFIRALDGHYPDGISSKDLLANMSVVNVASNEPLEEPRTDPSPEILSKKAESLAAARTDPPNPRRGSGGDPEGSPWIGLSLPLVPAAVALLLRRNRRRAKRALGAR